MDLRIDRFLYGLGSTGTWSGIRTMSSFLPNSRVEASEAVEGFFDTQISKDSSKSASPASVPYSWDPLLGDWLTTSDIFYTRRYRTLFGPLPPGKTHGNSFEKKRPIDGHIQLLTTHYLYVDVQCKGRPLLVAIIGWCAIDRILSSYRMNPGRRPYLRKRVG
ncbi:Hypothetical predicted protein [Olea europaea subsp. europaea]|uniref:Uncharacterized protein n=1 Tax=Olea europaea subsp. europaea TaxID=158383 RepID=A0A8S0VIH1_OLEEU|nr:Hypothetical predicted protein [Olea europaea subsp. europaea]